MALNTSVSLRVAATLEAYQDLLSVKAPLDYGKYVSLKNGTGGNQANQLFTDTRTLAASTSEDLDLSGVLTNPLGASITFTKIKAIIIESSSANANDVIVGGAPSNGLSTPFGDVSDKVKVKPGGLFCLIAPDANGYAVTAGTGDLLRVANGGSGSTVEYSIIVIGVV